MIKHITSGMTLALCWLASLNLGAQTSPEISPETIEIHLHARLNGSVSTHGNLVQYEIKTVSLKTRDILHLLEIATTNDFSKAKLQCRNRVLPPNNTNGWPFRIVRGTNEIADVSSFFAVSDPHLANPIFRGVQSSNFWELPAGAKRHCVIQGAGMFQFNDGRGNSFHIYGVETETLISRVPTAGHLLEYRSSVLRASGLGRVGAEPAIITGTVTFRSTTEIQP